MKQPQFTKLTLDKIVGGGQALGTLEDGRKAFVWGGLPGETVTIRVTKKKSKFVEGIVAEVHTKSPKRVAPLDPTSYLSTSPWQIMSFEAEQHYKAALIEEAFELHNIVLPAPIEVYTDNKTSYYRNKVEFSWFGDRRPAQTSGLADERDLSNKTLTPSSAIAEDMRPDGNGAEQAGRSGEYEETLDLAFFTRGGMGKIPVDSCSLLPKPMMDLAIAMRDLLRTKDVTARNLKTLLIRCDQSGNCVWQLYVKDKLPDIITKTEAEALPAQGGEVIYSDPRSPASRITERLATFGNIVLTDTILGVPFRYATEGFFQVNIPVYEQALRDMHTWINSEKVIDLYSGVGSIGLTIGGDGITLVELNEHSVREMRENIARLGKNATAVLAPSEKALEHISSDACIIVDPPRAGLHADVVTKLLEAAPPRIIYLSCNPVTQARDIALLAEKYGIRAHKGYNFFPRTPHIEHLIVLDKKPSSS
ncbi:MAG: TRAM domain-containing protein [Candidatus Saccharimonas sp.]